MYNVTIIGEQRAGKSSLCSQWAGNTFSESYCASILVEPRPLNAMMLYEIPCVSRQPVEQFYERTDVFVLVVRNDDAHHPVYERLSRFNRDASWLVVLNGRGEFPKSRLYAKNRDMAMTHVDLRTGDGVTASLKVLEEITRLHRQRPMPVSLLDEVYQWIPSCV